MTQPHGVLVVDKPAGMTSHDVVAIARRKFQTRAVGHPGTRHPKAPGVLVLLLGEGTKRSPVLTADDKRYRALVSFGRSTDTLDADGRTVAEQQLAPGWLSQAVLDAALDDERARKQQVPPAFSAIKVAGERAHRLSRKGEAPELAARNVTVKELVLLQVSDVALALELWVSKGYYVRALARDLCSALGVPGHLSELRRLQSGPFTIEEAVAWPLDNVVPGSVSAAARRCLPSVELAAESVPRARQGRELGPEDFRTAPAGEGPFAWLDPLGTLVAIGQATSTSTYRVLRGFSPDLAAP